ALALVPVARDPAPSEPRGHVFAREATPLGSVAIHGRNRRAKNQKPSHIRSYIRRPPKMAEGRPTSGPRHSSKRSPIGVGLRTGLVAASVSTSLLPKLAPCRPALCHTGAPIRDSLRFTDAQLYTARRHLCQKPVAVGTCVSWHAPRPDPYVRLSRIRLCMGV